MTLGIISTSADCVALLRQALPGHDCTLFASAEDGLAAARELGLTLLVLDLDAVALQPIQAESGLRALRQGGPTPTILLLAQPAHKPLLRSLRAAGADDYLLKPIRRNELTLRLDLLLHADNSQLPPRVVHAAGFSFDLDRLQVRHPARPALQVTLTQKESDLAQLLLSHMGRPLSRTFIQERIWGAEPELPTRTIDTHVSRVRTKLGLKPEFGFRLATVYGYGYQLEQLDGRDAPD